MMEPAYAVDPFEEDEPSDEALDVQAVLDEQPSRTPARSRQPAYRAGTRQVVARAEVVDGDGSWWMRPGADFGKEADRMRVQHAKLKVPGEFNVIGWGGAI